VSALFEQLLLANLRARCQPSLLNLSSRGTLDASEREANLIRILAGGFSSSTGLEVGESRHGATTVRNLAHA
jgi:hypothetical protein